MRFVWPTIRPNFNEHFNFLQFQGRLKRDEKKNYFLDLIQILI